MKVSATLIGILVVALGTGGYFYRGELRDYAYEVQRPDLPAETPAPEATTTSKSPAPSIAVGEPNPQTPKVTTTKSEVNLAVPFTSQAPFAEWDIIHEETCEEASMIMVDAFFNKKTFTPESAEKALLAMNDWEAANLGIYEDTTAAQTAQTMKEYFHFSDVTTRKITSQEDFLTVIKDSLSAGKLIIIPAAGRLLNNPYFTPPGPNYHMLVIKGYTKDGNIITNDPGTRRGNNYVYSLNTLYNALHDWNNGDTVNGEKVLVIVGKS